MFCGVSRLPRLEEGWLGREGGGENLLDNFAVCCRNVAACIVDAASHHIVGEVGLQNNVLRVHVHLQGQQREQSSGWGAVLRLVPRKGGGEADREVQRRERKMGRWRKTT